MAFIFLIIGWAIVALAYLSTSPNDTARPVMFMIACAFFGMQVGFSLAMLLLNS